jgi:hypothetical protein
MDGQYKFHIPPPAKSSNESARHGQIEIAQAMINGPSALVLSQKLAKAKVRRNQF